MATRRAVALIWAGVVVCFATAEVWRCPMVETFHPHARRNASSFSGPTGHLSCDFAPLANDPANRILRAAAPPATCSFVQLATDCRLLMSI
jgi:hypothetical protein